MPKRASVMSDEDIQCLSEPGFYAVGGVAGLHLSIKNENSKSWILRTTNSEGKRVDIGLGGYPEATPDDARERASLVRRQNAELKLERRQGNPKKRREEVPAKKIQEGAVFVTVKQVAARYGVSTPSVWRWTRECDFPKPIHLAANCTRWRIDDLHEWEERKARGE